MRDLSETVVASQHDGISEVQCPVCGFGYTYITGVHEIGTGAEYEAGWVRGKCWRIEMECEHDHSFAIEFGIHKGRTFVRVAPDHGEAHLGDYQEGK
mgnify:CR=1 FL=1